ncbi:MAG: ComF family protein [Alicyclobacillaceae bacterium]|nr:ComF family protein [Alicyclobacillaceae bacterium]
MPLWRRWTLPFLARRWLNTALNVLFPDSAGSLCDLCQRPVDIDIHPGRPTTVIRRRPDAASAPRFDAEAGNELADVLPDLPARLCLFCRQETVGCQPRPRCQFVSSAKLRAAARRGRVPVVSAMPHSGLVRHIIRQWKYDGRTEWTAWLADLMYLSAPTFDQAHPHPVDGLVPVPASSARFRMRGYDHVWLLAAHLAERLAVPVLPVLEVRANRTFTAVPSRSGSPPLPPSPSPSPSSSLSGTSVRSGHGRQALVSQTAKGRWERQGVQQGVYQLRPGQTVRGLHVVVVDDIVTTGSTVLACAKALYEAGAENVTAWVIAREE